MATDKAKQEVCNPRNICPRRAGGRGGILTQGLRRTSCRVRGEAVGGYKENPKTENSTVSWKSKVQRKKVVSKKVKCYREMSRVRTKGHWIPRQEVVGGMQRCFALGQDHDPFRADSHMLWASPQPPPIYSFHPFVPTLPSNPPVSLLKPTSPYIS